MFGESKGSISGDCCCFTKGRDRRVGLTGILVGVNKVLPGAVTVVVVDRDPRHVDGELFKVGTAVAVKLRIEVREQATLQQRVLAEVNAAHDVAGLEHGLLRLGKVVGWVAVKLQHAQLRERNELLGDDFGGIEQIEAERQRLVLINDLDGELPLRSVAGLDGIPEVLAVEVGVLAGKNLRLFPHQAGLALKRLEVPLDELGRAVLLYEPEGVHTKTVLVIVSEFLLLKNTAVNLLYGGNHAGCRCQPWPRIGYAWCSAVN